MQRQRITTGRHDTPCRFTGRILEDNRDASGRHLSVRLHGTDHEALLTWATGAMTAARVHLCPEGCSREAEGPGLIHCSDLRTIKSLEELVGVPWRDVLLEGRTKPDDELAGLRSRMEAVGGPGPAATAAAAEIEVKEAKEKEEKEKKKEKKKKRRSGSEAILRGPRAESQRGGDRGREKRRRGKALAVHPAPRAVQQRSNSRRSPRRYCSEDREWTLMSEPGGSSGAGHSAWPDDLATRRRKAGRGRRRTGGIWP